MEDDRARLSARVVGDVQGVGFRWWAGGAMDRLGLSGTATNAADGSVEVDAEGPRQRLGQLLVLLREGGQRRPGAVERVEERWS